MTLDDWRLPTEAEIELIDKLQNDSKSAVKRIMTGPFYWDAYLGNKAMRMTNPDNWNTGADEDKAHVRCVRDVKDNTI